MSARGSGLQKEQRGDILGADRTQFVTCCVVTEGEAASVSVV